MLGTDNLTTILCRLSRNLGTLTFWNPLGHCRPVTGLIYLHFTAFKFVLDRYWYYLYSLEIHNCDVSLTNNNPNMSVKYHKILPFHLTNYIFVSLLCLRPTGHCYPKHSVGRAYFKALSWHPGVSLYISTKNLPPLAPWPLSLPGQPSDRKSVV